MPLIGYARVSTADQSTNAQVEALRAAGCMQIHQENASGGDRSRPVLRRILETSKTGDTLVVVRIDRLARSLSHLLEVIEHLQEKGVAFRSIEDPIDTASPQGKFTLQVLGAAAEFERALIKERTRAGLQQARSEGRVGGNPGLKTRDKDALRKIRFAKEEAFFQKLDETATQWVPWVRKLRPGLPWQDLVKVINSKLEAGAKPWTEDRLKRAVKFYIREGLLDKSILGRAPSKTRDDRLMAIVAGMAGVNSKVTLQQIADRLTEMREETPRGRQKWSASSVKMLLDRARKHGMLPDGVSDVVEKPAKPLE